MALTDSFTDESSESAVFNPSDLITEYFVDGDFTGTIDLQATRPDADVWHSVHKIVSSNGNVKEHVSLYTPDAAVDYKVVAIGVTGTANVYLGP